MSAPTNPALPQPEHNLPNGEQEMPGLHPMVYVYKLLYFWPYLIMALVVGLAGAFIYNKYAEPVYKVNSSLMIIENKSGSSGLKNLDAALLSGGLGGMTSTTDNEMGIVQSYGMVHAALSELDFGIKVVRMGQFSREEQYPHAAFVVEVDSFHPQLTDLTLSIELEGGGRYRLVENGEEGKVYDPALLDYADGKGKDPVPSDIRQGTYAWGQWLEGKQHRFRLLRGDLAKGGGSRYQINVRSHQAVVNEYFGKAKVEPWKRQASLLYLSLETNNVDKGKAYLNKLMDVYLRQNLALKNQTSLNTVNRSGIGGD